MTGRRKGARPAIGQGRAASVAGVALLFLTILLATVGAVLFLRGGNFRTEWGLPGVQVLWALGFSAAGYPITRRHPANPVGWLLMVAGVAAGVNFLGVWLGITSGDGGTAPVLVSAWVVSVAALSSAVVHFPSGAPPSRWWRVQLTVLWGCGIFMYLYTANVWFADPPGWLNSLVVPVNIIFQLSLAAGCFSLLVRWRRSGPAERLQLKWVAYGVTLVGTTTPVVEIGLANLAPLWHLPGTVVISVIILTIPAAMGVAMLRYRLYDVDVVINRTLVYGVLSVSLAMVYVGAVVLLQVLFRAFTGEGSQLAVVASTLAIAALFNPLRRSIQSFIDRRFYRKKYDAARTLEAFGVKLRDETDLDVLHNDLALVVRDTVQPEYVSLWLRDPATDKKLGADDW